MEARPEVPEVLDAYWQTRAWLAERGHRLPSDLAIAEWTAQLLDRWMVGSGWVRPPHRPGELLQGLGELGPLADGVLVAIRRAIVEAHGEAPLPTAAQ